METFTASNGITVFVRDGGTVQFQHGTREESSGILQIYPHSEWWQTLREFFRAEEDERLGRWRWPENPDYVVYAWTADPPRRGVRGVTVLSESIPRGYTVWEDNIDTLYGTSVNEEARKRARDAARAYFDAHPEPKPWHEAKPWETWLITLGGVEQAVTLDDDRDFRDRRHTTYSSWVHITSEEITAGRRIWPEDAS